MVHFCSHSDFLDVKKGASEDHAVLQCSLFLGLGLDAYLAVGRLPGGVQQHAWVATREVVRAGQMSDNAKLSGLMLVSRVCGAAQWRRTLMGNDERRLLHPGAFSLLPCIVALAMPIYSRFVLECARSLSVGAVCIWKAQQTPFQPTAARTANRARVPWRGH